MRLCQSCPLSGMALKGWYSLSMGWTGRSWSVQAWCVSSKSQRRFSCCWTWRMQSSMWTSWCWGFSSWSSDWLLTWSCATKWNQCVKTLGGSHWWIGTLVHIPTVWDSKKTRSLSFSVSTSHTCTKTFTNPARTVIQKLCWFITQICTVQSSFIKRKFRLRRMVLCPLPIISCPPGYSMSQITITFP